MKFEALTLKDLVLVTPAVFTDDRGFFLETYNKENFHKAGLTMEFIQDNHSCSTKGVLRGLHFQTGAYAQGKLVRVTRGSVMDVVVDLRKSSSTYLKTEKVLLDDVKKQMLYVPEGFAHGFLALENCEVQYKCTNLYNKSSESGLRWNDADLNIDWGISHPLVSAKDYALPALKDIIDSLSF